MNLRDVQRTFEELPLTAIDEPVLPSRSTMDETKLHELADSIRIDGLQQPMVVARVGDRYEVIAGHRRRIACGMAGLVFAPCIVYASKTAALVSVQFWENYGREELNAADEATWFSELLERDCGGDVDVLCERLRRKRGYVEGRLLLFSGDPVVFAALQAGKIQIGVAHKLNEITDQQMRRYYLDAAIRGGATIAVVTSWVCDWKATLALARGEPAPHTPTPIVSDTAELHPQYCYICRRVDPRYLALPINVHAHCQRAILDEMINTYHGTAAVPT